MSTTTSDTAFTWIWLSGACEPVVAGRVDARGDRLTFAYGRSYLARADAIPVYEPELPLRAGRIEPLPRLDAPGCILDAGPDAWGQRVILNRLVGGAAVDTAELGPLTYLLESGSDRIGALDFQRSATAYEPRGGAPATLEELASSAQRVEDGVPLSAELDRALLHGNSVGGARPKALISDGPRDLIAKFSSTTDEYPVVKGEFVAMELARRAGLEVAPVSLARVLDKDVLLVKRFDRPGNGARRAVVSALTLLELSEMAARYASYTDLAEVVRRRFTAPRATLHELFARLTFNVLVGNTDDHARNHAAFWDGRELTLTPAYDVCPQRRSGGEATQAMLIGDARDGFRFSRVEGCVARCGAFQLREPEARAIVDRQIAVIRGEWDAVCDAAGLDEVGRRFFWGRQFLNPFALEGYAHDDLT